MVYYLVYVSSACRLMTTAELETLLRECRVNNRALAVTGALLYRHGTFMQVIEGPQEIVRDLYRRIQVDPRHHHLDLIVDGETDRRQFGEWSMAFGDLNEDVSSMSGELRTLLREGRSPAGDRPTVAQRLLLSFRETLARS